MAMNEAHDGTIARPVPTGRNRLLNGAAVLVATIAVATAAGLAIISVRVGPPTASEAPQGDAVDGWAPAMAERSAAKLALIEDGYLPGLLRSRKTRDAVDGWESSLVR
jgi:hypothetical protein